MDTLLPYIESLLGIQYKWWTGGTTCTKGGPFYVDVEQPPQRSQLEREGCNCAGFLNLLCQKLQIPIAGASEKLWNAGGTYIWFRAFQANQVLYELNPTMDYPPGTLFLRDYEDEENQGHIAIAVGNNQIAHCYPEDPTPVAHVLVGPGIQIEPFACSHAWKSEGYYTHVVLPEDWLTPSSCKMP
jgi:hypothetical protein